MRQASAFVFGHRRQCVRCQAGAYEHRIVGALEHIDLLGGEKDLLTTEAEEAAEFGDDIFNRAIGGEQDVADGGDPGVVGGPDRGADQLQPTPSRSRRIPRLLGRTGRILGSTGASPSAGSSATMGASPSAGSSATTGASASAASSASDSTPPGPGRIAGRQGPAPVRRRLRQARRRVRSKQSGTSAYHAPFVFGERFGSRHLPGRGSSPSCRRRVNAGIRGGSRLRPLRGRRRSDSPARSACGRSGSCHVVFAAMRLNW